MQRRLRRARRAAPRRGVSGMVKASTTPATVACTPDSSTSSHRTRAQQQIGPAARVTPSRFSAEQRRQHRGRAAQRGQVEIAGVEDGDDQHRAEIVDDRQRRQEHLQRGRHALAEQRQHAEREGDVGRGRESPSRAAPRRIVPVERDDRSAPGTAMPPAAAMPGRMRRDQVESWPSSTSRLISSPTSRKNTAISAVVDPVRAR